MDALRAYRDGLSTANPELPFGIPVEVSTQIFGFACAYDPEDPDSRVSPFHLGRICQAWRMVAWETSHLWSTIDIVLCPSALPMQLALLDECLKRSKDHLLSVYLRQRSSNKSFWHNNSQRQLPFISLVFAQAKRLRTFAATTTMPTFNDFWGKYHPFRFPALETLHIVMYEHGTIPHYDSKKGPYQVFKDSPSLHTVRIDGAIPPSIRLLPTQLAHLTLSGYHVPEWYQLFRELSTRETLKHLALTSHIPHNLVGTHESPDLTGMRLGGLDRITMPHLRILELTRCRFAFTMPEVYFLENLHLPNLDRLTLAMSRENLSQSASLEVPDVWNGSSELKLVHLSGIVAPGRTTYYRNSTQRTFWGNAIRPFRELLKGLASAGIASVEYDLSMREVVYPHAQTPYGWTVKIRFPEYDGQSSLSIASGAIFRHLRAIPLDFAPIFPRFVLIVPIGESYEHFKKELERENPAVSVTLYAMHNTQHEFYSKSRFLIENFVDGPGRPSASRAAGHRSRPSATWSPV